MSNARKGFERRHPLAVRDVMTVFSDSFRISTKGEGQILNITEEVSKSVAKSGLKSGLACVFISGSTCAITTTEFEPGLLKDIPVALDRLFPRNIQYQHDQTWHDGNGHSHVRAAFLGPSVTVPFDRGRLQLGTWQQLVLVELDIRSRQREILVKVLGEP